MLSRRRTHSPGCIGCMEGHPQTTALPSEVIDIIKHHWTSLTIIEYPWYLSDSVGMNAEGGESEKAQTRLVLVTKRCKGSHWSRCEILSDLALISHFQMVLRFCGLYNDYKWLMINKWLLLASARIFCVRFQLAVYSLNIFVPRSRLDGIGEWGGGGGFSHSVVGPLWDQCCIVWSQYPKVKDKTKGVYGIVYCGTWDLIDLVGFGKQL